MENIKTKAMDILGNQTGAVGYLVAWLLGVPATLLILIFLIRGH